MGESNEGPITWVSSPLTWGSNEYRYYEFYCPYCLQEQTDGCNIYKEANLSNIQYACGNCGKGFTINLKESISKKKILD